MIIYNLTQKKALAATTTFADTFWGRLLGLMGRKTLADTHGFVLYPCNAIHTCFMRFSIDLVFMDNCLKVVQVENTLKPFRFTKVVKNSSYAIELPRGRVAATGTKAGDRLIFLANQQYKEESIHEIHIFGSQAQ